MSPDLQTSRQEIINALSLTLTDRTDQIHWDSFTDGDWSLFTNTARVEGVAPLIHWNFKHKDTTGINIPTSVKAQLLTAYYNTSAQNQVIYQELERISKVLINAELPVVVLKGAALASSVYPEIGLRPMGDLDLLIKQKHLFDALSIIRTLDYIEEPVLSYRLKRRIGFNFHLWQKKEPNVKVELHWGLVGGQDTWYHPTIEWFWDQTEIFDANLNTLTLTPTAHTLYLAAHIWLQHGLSQAKLLWFYDLHLIINKFHKIIKWEELIYQSHNFQWTVALYETLTYMKKRFSTPVPEEFIKDINTSHIEKRSAFYERKAKQNNSRIDRYIARLSSMSISSSVIWGFAKIFPNPKYIKWQYKPHPEWTWLLYYPYRWFELLFKT
jgi:hypothetical protein